MEYFRENLFHFIEKGSESGDLLPFFVDCILSKKILGVCKNNLDKFTYKK